MIHGIGTDLAEIGRIAAALERHGERFAARVLSPAELPEWQAASDKARFLAKRFAAKEAFAKALGTGVRVPATLHAIHVTHDALGKPAFAFAPELAAHLEAGGLRAHLSVSDEVAYALAFVVLERIDK